ncbi:MAG: hypothetical protein GYA24_16085 [Candidatus Lokiarchaeota archaeon]|nr:hypothetical protein [Candidatus Lokiarchaeota archaeon]
MVGSVILPLDDFPKNRIAIDLTPPDAPPASIERYHMSARIPDGLQSNGSSDRSGRPLLDDRDCASGTSSKVVSFVVEDEEPS